MPGNNFGDIFRANESPVAKQQEPERAGGWQVVTAELCEAAQSEEGAAGQNSVQINKETEERPPSETQANIFNTNGGV